MLQVFAAVLSLAVIAVVLWDAFEVIVLPRRVTRRVRLTSALYRMTWAPVAGVERRFPPSKKRDRYLSFYGPLSLILLLRDCGVSTDFPLVLFYWSGGVRRYT